VEELLKRLEAARFTGHLDVHFDRGQVVSAKHWLTTSEFTAPLPVIEEGKKEEA